MTTALIPTVGPVAEAIRLIHQVINDRGLKPGDKLPTEREVALLAGLSRTTVRNALDALESQGLVLRQVGRGTFLSPAPAEPIFGRFELCSPAEIMAARTAIEPQFLPLAVTAASTEDIAEMRRYLADGEAAEDSVTFEKADMALHHCLARATHNSLLIMVSQLLIDARTQPIWGSLKRRTFNSERHHAYCSQHRAVVDALAERDADAAQQAMRAHLNHVRISLLG